MDKLDLQILAELARDARVSFNKIAQKTGFSTQTIIKRYKAMKKKGIIEYCSIKVDLHAIGYRGIACLLLTSKSGTNGKELLKAIMNRKNIIGATRTFGNYDVYAVLAFSDLSKLFSQIMDIKKIPSLEKMEISLTNLGHRYFPPGTDIENLKRLSNNIEKID